MSGSSVYVTPPFWCDYGYNITFGDNFYSNHNLIITDGAHVTIVTMSSLYQTVV